jgi:hypothetical protein
MGLMNSEEQNFARECGGVRTMRPRLDKSLSELMEAEKITEIIFISKCEARNHTNANLNWRLRNLRLLSGQFSRPERVKIVEIVNFNRQKSA